MNTVVKRFELVCPSCKRKKYKELVDFDGSGDVLISEPQMNNVFGMKCICGKYMMQNYIGTKKGTVMVGDMVDVTGCLVPMEEK